MEDHMETGGGPADGKRKGMTPISTPSPIQSSEQHGSMRCKKVRSKHSVHNVKPLQKVPSLREVSVTTALSKLRIGDTDNNNKILHSSRIARLAAPGSIRVPKMSTHAAMRKSKVDGSSSALVPFSATQRSLVTPSTPSQIPILSRAEASCATPATPSRIFKSSNTKNQFLTKDSNIPAFIAWDVRGRLEDMEAMYSELRDTLTGTSMERNGLEEAVAKFKIKRMQPHNQTCTSYSYSC
jgi:kinesin family protein C1